MNTAQKGKAAEYLAISKLLKSGYNVFTSAAEDSLIDIIYIHPLEGMKKCQIKSFFYGSKNEYHFKITKTSSNTKSNIEKSYNGFIDNFIAVDLQTNKIYIIPISFTELFKRNISLSTVRNNLELIKEL